MHQAVAEFLKNKATQNKGKAWNRMLKRDLTHFADWCVAKGITPANVNLRALEAYRQTWQGAPNTRAQRQDRLAHFSKYCTKHEWMTRNFAAELDAIEVPDPIVVPFTPAEFQRVIEAVEHYNPNSVDAAWRRQRAIAMLLLLRWSGLRISDAAMLKSDRLSDGKLFLYTAKTGQAVNIPLPPSVVKVLNNLPNLENPDYFFWSGQSDPGTPGKAWWKTLKRIFRKAGLPQAHPHTLRDTFATEMLTAYVTLEEVSKLLGHSTPESPKNTTRPGSRPDRSS